MAKKKMYAPIEPQYLKNKNGKDIAVYLDYVVYKSILKEVQDLEQKIKVLQKKSLLSQTPSKTRKQ